MHAIFLAAALAVVQPADASAAPPSTPAASPPAGSTAAPAAAPKVDPPELIQDSPAHYPDAALATRSSAKVTLQLTIDATGAVTQVEVKESAGPAFDGEALRAARGLRFKPARVDGKPAPVLVGYVYEFNPPPLAKAHLRGVLLERGSKRPLLGEVHGEGGQLAAETDGQGEFDLELPPGDYKILASAQGERTATFNEKLGPGEKLEVVYRLEPLRSNNYETVVRQVVRTEVSRVTFRAQEVSEVPGTMAGDPLRVVTDVPGATAAANNAPFPMMRGNSPGDTGYFLDGIRVPLLFHFGFLPGVIPSDFVESFDVYPGLAPIWGGRAIGGAIDVKVAPPRDNKIHATVTADLLMTGAFVNVPIEASGTTITAAARFSPTAFLLGKILQDTLRANFYDYQARVEQKIGTGKLRLLVFGASDDGVSIDPATQRQDRIRLGFDRVDLRYRQPVGIGDLVVGATWGRDTDSSDNTIASTNTQDGQETTVSAYASYAANLGKELKLIVGTEVERRSASLTVTSIAGGVSSGTTASADAAVFGAYAQADWQPLPGLVIAPGVRVDNYHLFGFGDLTSVDPRLSIRYQLTPGLLLKAGGGWASSPPTTLIPSPAASTIALSKGLQRSISAEVGSEWRPAEWVDLDLNFFYANMPRLIGLSPFGENSNLGVAQYAPAGSPADPSRAGVNYGAEVMIRHRIGGNWFGWIGYTLQHSERLIDYPVHDQYGNALRTETAWLPSPIDRTHTFNVVFGYKLAGNWTLGAALHLASGQLESGGPASYTHVEGTDPSGNPIWVPVDQPDLTRLPWYYRVDVRVAKTWVFDLWTLEAYLDFYNATLNSDVEGYTYASPEEAGGALLKTPILNQTFYPVIGVKARY